MPLRRALVTCVAAPARVEQYTDESKAEDLKATAERMEAEMGATLAALKKAAEGK